jgi:branched-chain amino acid aminotransferase
LGFWSANSVFDGARAIKGCAPDLDRHCARVIRSAKSVGLEPDLTADQIFALCVEAIRALPVDLELYVRPMFYSFGAGIMPEEAETRFTLAVFEMPLPDSNAGRATVTSQRRPAPDQGPTDSKAGALYPNSQRARREAGSRGFEVAVVLDPDGNLAEFSHANLAIAKDGVAITPKPNGTFLNGITRNRAFQLLKDAGIPTEERVMTVADLETADEIFMCGNAGKVQVVTGFEARALQPGPVFRTARDRYMEFVATQRVH